MMKDWHLARRDLLKRLGLGAACLPLLGASRARGAPLPHPRLLIVQTGQGYRQSSWKPQAGPLAGQVLPPSCAPLEPWKDELIFLPDLTNPNIGTSGTGAYGVTFYGLGATGTGQYREPAGMTLDQVVGSALQGPGQRTSLNLGVQLERPPRPSTAPGATCCFWSGAGLPIRPMGDPALVYKELMSAGPADNAAVRRLVVRRKSILDYVRGNLEGFGKRLGTDDRAAVEAHLQALRDLERQVVLVQRPSCELTQPIEALDLNAASSYPRILDAHLDLMVLALRCGVTNVATLQTSNATGENVELGNFIPGIPPGGNYKGGGTRTLRDVSRTPVMTGTDMKRLVDTWLMGKVAALLGKLEAPGPDGVPLLANTVVLIGNHLNDGASQDAQKLPWLMAGNCREYFDTGRCLASAGRPTASVMAALCEALGAAHPYGAAMPELKKV
jgi:hypothetical protein